MRGSTKTKYLQRLFLDFIVITFCFVLVRVLFKKYHEHIFDLRSFVLLGYILSAWYFAAKLTKLYTGFLDRILSAEWVALIKTYLTHFLAVIAALYFLSRDPIQNKWFLIVFEFLLFYFLAIEKYLARWYFGSQLSDRYKIPIIIIGTEIQGIRFYQRVLLNSAYNYKLTGFIGETEQPLITDKYLGKIDELDSVLNQHSDVEELIIALPNSLNYKIKKIIKSGEKKALKVRIVPDYYEFTETFGISDIASIPVISVRKISLEDSEIRLLKRVFDILFSTFIILLVLSWLYPIIALLIKLESKGPVLFKQLRSGQANKNFYCYKFRSMRSDNDKLDLQAQKNDSRLTRIGKFIRKTSIDELPQFFNVLIGNMSVVGPRPHMVEHTEKYAAIVDEYMIRHYVQPGITGWAQINGFRGETKDPSMMEARIRHDIWYIEHWSFWLDLQIIIQTVINVFKGEKNAY